MHYSIVRYILGQVLQVESALLILPFVTGLIYREQEAFSFLVMALACLGLGALMKLKKPEQMVFYAREAITCVALSWIMISIFGALPFVINGDIPSFTDALFETISGFTTTGASILPVVEDLSHASLIWRSFTHWVGGMGVIVFMLAIVPMTGGYNAQLMKAESPGPTFGKLVPKLKDSAMILYLIYIVMTLIQIVLLCLAGMPLFDSLCMSFGSAGTGGFGITGASAGGYTMLQQGIITVFIIMFGVNFNAYYLIVGRNFKDAFRMEEVRWYLLIIASAVVLITSNVRSFFDSWFEAFHHTIFQVASIITTTGYSTVDFNQWPDFSRCILVTLMFIGACAGSTGGGIKVSRIVILLKSFRQQVMEYIHPRSVTTIEFDGRPVEKNVVRSISAYLATFVMIFAISMLILSMDHNSDLLSGFTAVAATFNNIGPGLDKVGPMANYGGLSVLSKYTLMFDMLAGRLELYPMIILLFPRVWKRN